MAEWPLVGRSEELVAVSRLVSEGRAVVIAGSAGVGKTRLAQECLKAAAADGRTVASVTATRSAATLPFGALAPLLSPAPGRRRMQDRIDLLRHHAEAVANLAPDGRLVLLVDDAHLLDDASATLVHQLAVTGLVVVVATIRTGELAPDPVVALWKDGVAERLDVRTLGLDAVEEVLSAALGGRVERATALELARRSAGNALFLRELVVEALGDGAFSNEDEVWRLTQPLRPSDRLMEIIELRFKELPADAHALLEVVAVAEVIGPAELAQLSDAAVAERLARDGILSTQMDGRRLEIRMAHPIYGDVLRTRLPAIEVRRIEAALAQAIQATEARRQDDNLRVGTWWLTSGGGQPDILLAAAVTARWRYDFSLAERLARAAVSEGAGFDAALLAAQCAAFQGASARAETELRALAEEAADDEQRCRVAHARLDTLIFDPVRAEEAVQIFEAAEAAIADPVWRDEITARRGAFVLEAQGPRAAGLAVGPLLDRAKGETFVWAAMVAAYSEGRMGYLESSQRIAAEGQHMHEQLSTPIDWYPWIFLVVRLEALTAAGSLYEAEALAQEQYEEGIRARSAEAEAFFAWQLAKIARERGRVRSASRFGYEAVALFRQLNRPTNICDTLDALALALALSGRRDEAAETLRAIEPLDPHGRAHTAADHARAQAWAVVPTQPARARRILAEAVDLAEQRGDLVGAIEALHDLARLGQSGEVRTRLADLSQHVEGPLARYRAEHVAALTETDPYRLAAIADTFEELGADLLAAEAGADSAVIWRQDGDRRALQAAVRAATLAERCEGAVTPALMAVDARANLTAAERRIALLATEGRTSKEIAEEVRISARTVENHLQHVYQKLGIRSREELAASLASFQPVQRPRSC